MLHNIGNIGVYGNPLAYTEKLWYTKINSFGRSCCFAEHVMGKYGSFTPSPAGNAALIVEALPWLAFPSSPERPKALRGKKMKWRINMDSFIGFESLPTLFGLTWSAVPSLISLAVYIFSALGMYTLAQRRGLRNPWLAWIPVVNVWILGSLSDQYRYVVRGQVRSKRKVLLTLNIISTVMGVVIVGVSISAIIRWIFTFHAGASEAEILDSLLGSVMGLLALCLPCAGVAIASAVVSYMALYDVYTSCDPANNTVYLVLSILFGFTKAIFLFLCRNRDDGMPPRRDAKPQYRQSVQEPWEQQDNGGTNYL